jgi:hypothetical protein
MMAQTWLLLLIIIIIIIMNVLYVICYVTLRALHQLATRYATQVITNTNMYYVAINNM